MQITTSIIEFIFSAALFINGLLFIPQAVRIFQEKSAKSVSLITFLGFLLIQMAIILHGIIRHDTLLVWGYLFSILTCGAVVGLTLFYRAKTSLPATDSEIPLEEILKQLSGHIYWKNREGVCLGCNTNNWRDFGLKSLQDFIGKTDYDLFPKEEADKLRLIDQEVMRTGQLRIAEEELSTADGKKTLYLSHKMPLKDKNNKIIGIIGVSVDITSAKRETSERLEMLENIIAVMPGNVYWLNKEGIYLGCNDNEAKAVGLNSRKEIIGKRNLDIPGFVIPEVIDSVNQQVMESKRATLIEEPAMLPDGTKATFLSNKVPLFNSQREVIGMVGISFDITDRKKAEHELENAKEAAEAANRAKTQFLFNMRHDLRTPFSGILGIAEFMENSEKDENKKENLSYITQAARVLLDHLNEIFEFTLAETGQLPLIQKQFDLKKLLADTYKMHLPAAKDKNLILEVNADEDLPKYIIGDPVRTQRILINLISNAIKFTDKGHVRFLAKLGKESSQKSIIKFIVEDTGVGIPEDQQDMIFEQFNRVTASYSGIYPGKGLGLKMVKHFLDEMEGEIHLKSKVNKGTEFKVLIPYKKTLLDCPEEQL